MISETDLPDIDTDTEEGDGEKSVFVSAAIHTPGESLNANAVVPPDSTDDEVAAILLRVALAVAALHGTGTWMALQHRLVDGSQLAT